MKVNRPGAPFGNSADPSEPLDPRDLQGIVKGERFAAVFADLEGQSQTAETGATTAAGLGSAAKSSSATRAALEQIAKNTNLSDQEGAAQAVRASAGVMVQAGLGENFRNSPQSGRLIGELSEHILADPLLKNRLLSILNKLQNY